jgi:hypothetical protein
VTRCDCEGTGFVPCPECYGRGYFVDCPDDLCHGGDYCIHGDGETTCAECHGTGEVRCHCDAGREYGS